jgi:membrane-bound lytic murein transglycosylase D
VDLRLAAQCVDVSAGELQNLNPSLLRMTTPKDHEFQLRLPAGSKEKFEAAISMVPPEMRVWWRYHKVSPGDTLSSIARAYRSTPKAIAAANHIEGGEALPLDSKLAIPIAPGKHAASEDGATYARRATRYRIRKGDTVQTVADNFGVPASMVRRWNKLKGDSLRGRKVVYVHLPITPDANRVETASVSAKSKQTKKVQTAPHSKNLIVHHRVKHGETLYSIADTYNTTVDALKRDNRNVATLRPGMVLVIR